ncbi:MAG: hypothetical protein Q8K65_00510 [Alphaproteobacteria bacterium]|nr:hypothetical protein [Alphaproteobacteria bacterium]
MPNLSSRLSALVLAAMLLAAPAVVLLAAPPAYAMEDVFSAQKEAVENPGGGMKVVTPLKDCLDKLPPEEADAVRSNYLKPYQECHMRLQAFQRRRTEGKETARDKKARKDAKDDKAKDDKDTAEKEPAPAQSPRNFVRVRKDDGPRRPASYGDIRETPAESRPRPAWDSGYNR